ncbi:MAG: dihydrodipicolinate synthase family protein, partial [Hyphomicrobiales bacterium]|nr:dihydrodipicolinate synthase family protein [Hyphomicrobiales bacterium]
MSKDLQTALTGISGILVTPFGADGDIAAERQKPIVDRAIGAGVGILTANGNTGEFYALTTDEATAMVEASAGHIAGRVPMVAGVGRGIEDACHLAAASASAGAAALMIHQPPDPFVAPRGLIDYVMRISESGGGLPLILYIRNDTIGIPAIAALCALPAVIGVKWATPNPMKL